MLWPLRAALLLNFSTLATLKLPREVALPPTSFKLLQTESMNEPRLGISEDESDLDDSRHKTAEPLSTPHREGETPHSSHTDGRPCIHATHTSDSSSAKHPPWRHRGPRIHPVLAPHRPQTLHSPLAPPLTRHTPAHTSHTALSSLAQHPPCRPPHAACIHPTHLADSGATQHTWHNPQTPTSMPHTPHTPQTPLSPRTHPAGTAHSVSAAPARSGAAASAGGAARVRSAGRRRREEETRLSFSDPRFGGGSPSGKQRPRPRTPRDPARAPEPSAARAIPVACAARYWRPQDPRLRPCRRPRPPLATAFLSTHRSPPSSPTLFSIGNSQLSPGRRHRLRRGRRRRSEELRQPPLKPRRGGRREL